jgi:hypothetical protein
MPARSGKLAENRTLRNSSSTQMLVVKSAIIRINKCPITL